MIGHWNKLALYAGRHRNRTAGHKLDVRETNAHYWRNLYNFVFVCKVTAKWIRDLNRKMCLSRSKGNILLVSLLVSCCNNTVAWHCLKTQWFKTTHLSCARSRRSSGVQLARGDLLRCLSFSSFCSTCYEIITRVYLSNPLLIIASSFGNRHYRTRHFMDKYFHFSS